jgi:hypothetical protein
MHCVHCSSPTSKFTAHLASAAGLRGWPAAARWAPCRTSCVEAVARRIACPASHQHDMSLPLYGMLSGDLQSRHAAFLRPWLHAGHLQERPARHPACMQRCACWRQCSGCLRAQSTRQDGLRQQRHVVRVVIKLEAIVLCMTTTFWQLLPERMRI